MASQQSWTSWVLDAYASVVSSGPSQEDEKSEEPTAANSQNSTVSSSSPYGPYVRTGRGGAGNFTWQSPTPSSPQQQQQHQDDPNSLEAQNPSTLSERRKAAAAIEHLDTTAALQAKAAQRPTSQYVRVGRGFVQSNEVQQSSPQSPIAVPVPKNTAVAHPGRGGAGNHAAAAEVNARVEEEKRMKEQAEAEQRRGKIEELVQSELPAPPDAWLGGRRRSVDPPEGRV